MAIKLFVSHAWDDADLVQKLKVLLDRSAEEYQITSVERTSPIDFSREVSETSATLNAVDQSIRELERRRRTLVEERSAVERDERDRRAGIVRPKISEEKLGALLKRFEGRMGADASTNASCDGTSHSQPRRDVRPERIPLVERFRRIDDALAEHKEMRDSLAVRLSDMEETRGLSSTRSKIDGNGRSDPIDSQSTHELPLQELRSRRSANRREFTKYVNSFFKNYGSPINMGHPSLQNFPTALLISLYYRLCGSDVFVTIFTEKFMFSIWCRLELDLCYKLGVPSICIDASPDASAPAYLKLTDHYLLWSRRTQLAEAIEQLYGREKRFYWNQRPAPEEC